MYKIAYVEDLYVWTGEQTRGATRADFVLRQAKWDWLHELSSINSRSDLTFFFLSSFVYLTNDIQILNASL